MSDILNAKIKLLIKCEKALFVLELKKKIRQFSFVGLAVLTIFLGVITLNITIFFYLDTRYSALVSTAILTGINIFTSLIFLIAALNQTSGAEAQPIEEIRDFARLQIKDDFNEAKDTVTKTKQHIDVYLSGFRKLMPIICSIINFKKQ
ncbi:MAG: phage holin family protein [Psychromonas sp.]|nr:phage holin family protein [Psychromonas sp.]